MEIQKEKEWYETMSLDELYIQAQRREWDISHNLKTGCHDDSPIQSLGLLKFEIAKRERRFLVQSLSGLLSELLYNEERKAS